MKAHRIFPTAALLAVVLLLPGSRAHREVRRPLVLAATFFPAADIARRVAGPDVRVIQVLPAGASPHTFDLTPGQVRELQPARAIFKIGAIDDWIDGVAESLPQATLIALHKGIVRLPFHEDGHDPDHNSRQRGEEFDPHYWLSAENGITMARNIASALSAIDPSRSGAYEANFRDYAKELEGLHRRIKNELSALKNNKMAVFHDAWRYFAAAYGLEIVAVFQASPGREPTPRHMQKMYSLARKFGIKVIFSEPQLSIASFEPLLHDLKLKRVILDPLGGTEAGDSYAGLLSRIARTVRLALER